MLSVRGFVKIILFQNRENGYHVIKFKLSESVSDFEENELVTVTGYFPLLETNKELIIKGRVNVHPKYGEQIIAEGYEEVTHEDEESLILYFQSDLFFGIGPVLARKIVDTLGMDAIDQILKDPTCLAPLGVGERKQKQIHSALETNQGLQTILQGLYKYGFSAKLAMMIYHKYYNQSLELIGENPYRLLEDFDGIQFKTVDEIAAKLGFSEDNDNRIDALSVHFLKQNYTSGDTFEQAIILAGKINQVLNAPIDEAILLERFNSNPYIVALEGEVFLNELYDAELYAAENLLSFNYRDVRIDFLDAFNKVEEMSTITFSEKQKEAIMTALSEPVTVITGGPGTGKTTILKALIESYKISYNMHDDRKIALLSPTGRAAKRMAETTGYDAKTIHSFLGYDFRGEFTYHEEHKQNAKFVVVDESSMIDVYLFDALLRALKSDTKIVFIGDVDQLPSVGPGQVLKDIIDSETVPVIRLDNIYRQEGTSKLIQFASHILEGIVDQSDFGGEIQLLDVTESSIINVVRDVVETEQDQSFSHTQILAPMYKGLNGIDAINQSMQKAFNPGEGISHLSREFRVHDQILQLENQPEDSIMNGDIGTVVSIKPKLVVNYDSNLVTYQPHQYMKIKHAYAISIHKSQGNEYETVILPLTYQSKHMLTKKLLYTAVTRAKQKLYIIGNPALLKDAVNHDARERQTKLRKRLTEYGS